MQKRSYTTSGLYAPADCDAAAVPQDFLALMRQYAVHKRHTGNSPAFAEQIEKTMRYLTLFAGDDIAVSQIDVDFCIDFIEYLKNAVTAMGRGLAPMTQAAYFRCFNCALNWAVKKGFIVLNPVARIETDMKPKVPESTREFLTQSEILSLIDAPCKNAHIKRAYLFACFCGLRYSDVKALTWGNVFIDGCRTRLRIIIRKTRKSLYLPLSRQAMRWMPVRPDNASVTDSVFRLPSIGYVNIVLKGWAKDNGISKTMTFHTSRHTFATLCLQADVNLYTVSKLLGHTQVKTTQIYAKVIDRQKDEAVDALGRMFV